MIARDTRWVSHGRPATSGAEKLLEAPAAEAVELPVSPPSSPPASEDHRIEPLATSVRYLPFISSAVRPNPT
jgi:hypothetical protein